MRARETRFTGDIISYGPRRRRWARPALMVLLVALVLWLMSGGVFGAESASFMHAGPALSVLPPESVLTYQAWQQGIVIGLSAAAIIGVTFAAALKVKRDDEAALERSRAGVGKDLASPSPCSEDPLSAPFSGIDEQSMIRITEALQKQTESAADWVRCAKATICRHEQEDMLRLALRDLEPVNACLPELMLALQKQAGGQVL